MDKIVALELEFLGIPEEERGGYLSLCKIIEGHKELPMQIFHRMRCFFEAFIQWRKGEISDEEFLSMGDLVSSSPIYGKNKISSWELFTEQNILDELKTQTLIVADEKSFFALSKSEQEEIQKKLKKTDSLLLLC